MAIFLVTPLARNFAAIKASIDAKVAPHVATEEAIDHFELPNEAGFLVSHSGTTEEICIKIGIITNDEANSKPLGSAVVTRISSYYGIAPTLVWEWMKSRMEKG